MRQGALLAAPSLTSEAEDGFINRIFQPLSRRPPPFLKPWTFIPWTRDEQLSPLFAPGDPPGGRTITLGHARHSHAGDARAGKTGCTRLPPGPRLAAMKAWRPLDRRAFPSRCQCSQTCLERSSGRPRAVPAGSDSPRFIALRASTSAAASSPESPYKAAYLITPIVLEYAGSTEITCTPILTPREWIAFERAPKGKGHPRDREDAAQEIRKSDPQTVIPGIPLTGLVSERLVLRTDEEELPGTGVPPGLPPFGEGREPVLLQVMLGLPEFPSAERDRRLPVPGLLEELLEPGQNPLLLMRDAGRIASPRRGEPKPLLDRPGPAGFRSDLPLQRAFPGSPHPPDARRRPR